MAEFSLTKMGQQFVQDNMKLAWKFMYKYPISPSYRITREQYESELMMVLIKCTVGWDPSIAKFSTYCWLAMHRERWRLTVGRRNAGREEFALPLDGQLIEGREKDPSFCEPDYEESLKSALKAMEENPADGNLLAAHYLRGMTFAEIGRIAGVSREATRQRVVCAIRRIGKRINEKRV